MLERAKLWNFSDLLKILAWCVVIAFWLLITYILNVFIFVSSQACVFIEIVFALRRRSERAAQIFVFIVFVFCIVTFLLGF